MASFLAIETSTPACSVALMVDGAMTSRYSEEPRSHTRLVMAMVNELLSESNQTVQQLDAIGVTIGPGSFTGLRIGFATVQGLAFGGDVPVVASSTLEIMVATYLRKHCADQSDNESDHKVAAKIAAKIADKSESKSTQGNTIVAILDARMGEFNCGCYQVGAYRELEALTADQLLSAEQTVAFIEKHQPQMVIGEAGRLVEDNAEKVPCFTPVFPDAIDVLARTAAQHNKGLAQPIDSIELVYLRGTDAWQKRKRLRAL